MKWDFEELNNLCIKKGVLLSKEYQSTLVKKQRCAYYHRNESLKLLEEFSEQYGHEINLNCIKTNIAFEEAIFKSICHTEAALQSIHSMMDILLQVINITILQKPYSVDIVCIKKIRKTLGDNEKAKDFLIKLNCLISSEEFSYISAFVNTIKHRKLIRSTFHAEGGNNTRNDQGLVIKEFDYKNKQYPTKWVKDIFNNDFDYIYKSIMNIGIEINEFLK